jgi:hypothetical protein
MRGFSELSGSLHVLGGSPKARMDCFVERWRREGPLCPVVLHHYL